MTKKINMNFGQLSTFGLFGCGLCLGATSLIATPAIAKNNCQSVQKNTTELKVVVRDFKSRSEDMVRGHDDFETPDDDGEMDGNVDDFLDADEIGRAHV